MRLIDADNLLARAEKLNLDYNFSDVGLRELKWLLKEEPTAIYMPSILTLKEWDKETKARVLEQAKAVAEIFDKCVKLTLLKSEEELH